MDKPKRGRPTTYDHDVAKTICDRLASGETLRAICRDDGMPNESTVRYWAKDDREGFFALYARSVEVGYDCMAESLLDIANTPLIGEEVEISENGTKIKRGDMLGHRRLQIDTIKWLLSKRSPKYGDRIDHVSTDGSMTPKPMLDTSKLSEKTMAEILAASDAANPRT